MKVDLTVDNDTLVRNDLTVLNTTNVSSSIVLNSQLDTLTAPTASAGLTVNRGSSTDASFTWDETNDYWTTGTDPSDATQLTRLVARIDGGTF